MAAAPCLCLSLSLQLATAHAREAPVGVDTAVADATLVIGIDPRLALSIDDVTTVLRSHLAGTGLTPEVRMLDADALALPTAWAEQRLRGATGARAVFWVVADAGDVATLHLWLPGDAGAWARTLPDEHDRDARTESIGVMVRAMATSIEVASPAVPPPAPAATTIVAAPPSPPPVVRPPPRTHVDLALGYLGSNLADRAPWQSGPSLRAQLVHPSRASVALGLAWAPSQHAGDALTITRVAIDASAGVMLRPQRRVRPSILVGGVIEAMGWGLRGFGRGWGLRAAVTAAAGLDVALSPRVGLVALARIDAWLRNATLVVDGPTGREPLLRGHPAAAAVFLGVRVRLGGEFLHPRAPRPRHGDR